MRAFIGALVAMELDGREIDTASFAREMLVAGACVEIWRAV